MQLLNLIQSKILILFIYDGFNVRIKTGMYNFKCMWEDDGISNVLLLLITW